MSRVMLRSPRSTVPTWFRCMAQRSAKRSCVIRFEIRNERMLLARVCCNSRGRPQRPVFYPADGASVRVDGPVEHWILCACRIAPQESRIHPELIARAKTIPAGEITARIRPQTHSQAVTGPPGVILESSLRCRK